MNLDKCSEKITHKNILIEEKKSSKIIFGNENLIEVTKVQVDGCLDIQGVKCDWLLIIYEPYIEITSVESCNKTLQSLRFTQVKSIVY
ncbi:MAG: hypothetical protein WCO49_12255 [Nostocales cyanobacterium ELA608]